MKISVSSTKDAGAYQVFLNGEPVPGWIEADDVAGTVTREVPDTTGGARFMRREVTRGVVVIRAPKPAKKAE